MGGATSRLGRWAARNPLAVLGVVVLLACSSGAKTGTGAEGTKPTGPGLTAADPAPWGTVFEVAKGWDMTVNSVMLFPNTLLAETNQFNIPADGKTYVMANVGLANESDLPGTVGANIEIRMMTPGGVSTEEAFGVVTPDELDMAAQLQPKATITGNIVFEVPVGDVNNLVVLAEPAWTTDAVEDQRFWKTQA